jgi:hypothetical protein
MVNKKKMLISDTLNVICEVAAHLNFLHIEMAYRLDFLHLHYGICSFSFLYPLPLDLVSFVVFILSAEVSL